MWKCENVEMLFSLFAALIAILRLAQQVALKTIFTFPH